MPRGALRGVERAALRWHPDMESPESMKFHLQDILSIVALVLALAALLYLAWPGFDG